MLPNWERLTDNKSILNIVEGLELKFLSKPVQNRAPKSMNMSMEEKMSVEQEIQKLRSKGAITRKYHCKSEFARSLFLREKNDGWCRPEVNLKSLNHCLPYNHFKMEGPKQVKKLLKKRAFVVKLDLQMHISVYQSAEKARNMCNSKGR